MFTFWNDPWACNVYIFVKIVQFSSSLLFLSTLVYELMDPFQSSQVKHTLKDSI